MCGITARIGTDDGVGELLTGLKNLEYRGYDSAGIAIKNGRGLSVHKQEGDIDRLTARVDSTVEGTIGIGHTRWSTHGPPTDENAHPHTDCTGEIAVVHNGIIENYDSLKRSLRDRGHVFTSETDTEVIPHLVEEELDAGHPPDRAFREAVQRLSGSYAIAMVLDEEDAIYATRNGSPLVLGLENGTRYLASDVPAFLDFTDEVVYLADGDVAIVTPDSHVVRDLDGNRVQRRAQIVDWDPEDAGKAGYDHYMLKEIHEQPTALRQTIRGRVDHQAGEIELEEFPPRTFSDVEEVQLVACGTSYHAAMYATRLLSRHGVSAQSYLAGEYASSPPPIGERSLVVGVTQSGETADTLSALRRANDAGARTLAVTNVVGSTVTRECDESLFIRAGPEIGVAATKTFSSQVVTLTLLSERLARDCTGQGCPNPRALLESISSLPAHVQEILDGSRARSIAERYRDSDAYFFIGRGTVYPVALEGALKFKEISYEHAEGFAAAELKHGPLALVTEDTPVFAVFDGRNDEKTLSNVKEVQARRAPVVGVTADDDELAQYTNDLLSIPETHPDVAGILANVQLQLIAYHAANLEDRPIDKPRNLAKSVTVE